MFHENVSIRLSCELPIKRNTRCPRGHDLSNFVKVT